MTDPMPIDPGGLIATRRAEALRVLAMPERYPGTTGFDVLAASSADVPVLLDQLVQAYAEVNRLRVIAEAGPCEETIDPFFEEDPHRHRCTKRATRHDWHDCSCGASWTPGWVTTEHPADVAAERDQLRGRIAAALIIGDLPLAKARDERVDFWTLLQCTRAALLALPACPHCQAPASEPCRNTLTGTVMRTSHQRRPTHASPAAADPGMWTGLAACPICLQPAGMPCLRPAPGSVEVIRGMPHMTRQRVQTGEAT